MFNNIKDLYKFRLVSTVLNSSLSRHYPKPIIYAACNKNLKLNIGLNTHINWKRIVPEIPCTDWLYSIRGNPDDLYCFYVTHRIFATDRVRNYEKKNTESVRVLQIESDMVRQRIHVCCKNISLIQITDFL